MGKKSIWSPEAIARMNERPVTRIMPELTREGAIQAKGIFSESEIPLKDIPPFIEDMAEALVQIKGTCSRDVYETFLVAHFEDVLQAIADDDAWLAAGAAWLLANRLQQASAWGKLAGSGLVPIIHQREVIRERFGTPEERRAGDDRLLAEVETHAKAHPELTREGVYSEIGKRYGVKGGAIKQRLKRRKKTLGTGA